MKRTYETQFYTEDCCEQCQATVHTHFECPKCKDNYAGTDIYGDIENNDVFSCEECGEIFTKINHETIEQEEKE